MRVLVVDGYDPSDSDAHISKAAARLLEQKGNTVEVLHLHKLGFAEPMSAAERQAYPSGSPLITDVTRSSAAAVRQADALVFCYPTVMFGVPPVLKSWLERVLVEGVSFQFDAKNRLRPAMTHVRRLVAITTSPHSGAATRSARDLGRRTIMWTVRLNCHRLCRRTFLRLPRQGDEHQALAKIESALSRW